MLPKSPILLNKYLEEDTVYYQHHLTLLDQHNIMVYCYS